MSGEIGDISGEIEMSGEIGRDRGRCRGRWGRDSGRCRGR